MNHDDDFAAMVDEAMFSPSRPKTSRAGAMETKHKVAIILAIAVALICTALLGYVIGGGEGALVAVLPIMVIAGSVYWLNRRNF